MFPRYRFQAAERSDTEARKLENNQDEFNKSENPNSKPEEKYPPLTATQSSEMGEDITPRTWKQKVALVHYYSDDQTTWFQYFRRPFYLFAFPNIVLAGIQFAFGCTAGIVSFNTISEIMTEAPYNWSAGSTGLIFLAALVGNFMG